MYKIIVDSCGELTEEMQADGHFASVPLILQVNGEDIVDDESFNQLEFIRKVAECPTSPVSSCPSPEAYKAAMEGEAERIYVVTLSAKLSGSYNSACLAKKLMEEECPGKRIHVFNSCSASVGETLIALKAHELEKSGLTFDEICLLTENYIKKQNTFFVLETLETLRKAGRLSNLKATIASVLNIKPVMGATDDGQIMQLSQSRGMGKTMDKMVEHMIEATEDCDKKVLAISHCNCLERALELKKRVEAAAKFKEIIILDMRGVSTMYANDGGVIMVV